jgi:cytochrome c biogenesis protein CcmG/thiol:disulfide interchange protein DsbE
VSSSTKTVRPSARRSPQRSYTPFIVLGAIVVVALGNALLATGGDDDGGTGSGDLLATAAITVRGAPLPPLPEGGADPAAGTPAPTLEGVDPTGQGTEVAYEQPTLVAFLAHWCPHCQAELPELVALAEEGALDDMDAVVVLTGTDETRPNHPPAPWLEEEGWTGRVILDDEGGPAASAFGLTSYPYVVLVDADGDVIARNAGGLGLDGLRQFVRQAG